MSDPVTYTAVLRIGEATLARLAQLLQAERIQRRTRPGRRALGARLQAILVLRWFCDATRAAQLASPAGLSVELSTINMLRSATRALAERGNSLLKTTSKALRRVSLCPWRVGAITAAAIVLLHTEHERTT